MSSAARLVGGLAVSVLAAWLVLRSIDLPATVEILQTAAWGWVAGMLLLVLVDVTVRAVRWRALLAPVRRLPLARVLGYLFVGYLANNVLPARLGEVVRSHYVGDRERMSRGVALGTVAVERVIDVLCVVGVAAVAVFGLSAQEELATSVLVGVGVVLLLVAGVVLLLVVHRLPGAGRLAALADRQPRVGSLLRRFRDGLAVVQRPSVLALAVAISLLAWSLSVLLFFAGAQAVAVELTLPQAALLAAGVALATSIPSGPGYLGTYELAAVTIGATFGLAAEEAFAVALLTHAVILAATTLGGAASLLQLGWGRGRAAATNTTGAERRLEQPRP